MSDFANVFTSWKRPLLRTTRRVLVVAALVVLIGWSAASLADLPYSDLAVVPMLALWMLIVVRVSRSLQCLLDRPDARLDERERELRRGSYARAYQIVMALSVALLLIPVLAIVSPDGFALVAGDDPARGALLLLAFYATVVLTLPWALLAWRLPDPVQLDEAAAA